MRPATYDVQAYRGDGYALAVHLEVGGAPADVGDGTEYAAQWRPTLASDTHEDFEITPTGPGVLRLTLTGEQTTRMAITGRWDLEHRPTDGEPRTLLAGRVTITRDVTRA